jgi:hypothetical protein
VCVCVGGMRAVGQGVDKVRGVRTRESGQRGLDLQSGGLRCGAGVRHDDVVAGEHEDIRESGVAECDTLLCCHHHCEYY